MNKHTIREQTLADFMRNFAALQDCLDKCGETVVKVRFHIGYYWYSAKVWSEKMEGGEK